MPTEKKVQVVERLRKLIEDSVVAISADYSGMKVGDMTDLRRALRESGVEFHVVKNRLTHLAADAAGRPLIKDIVQGPTAIAFGFDDPLGPAKALTAFITSTRSPLKITGGVLGERALSAVEVGELAVLPGKEELLARLVSQLQGPITSLAYVLSAPASAVVRVLQRHIEGMGEERESGAEQVAPTPGSQDQPATDEAAAEGAVPDEAAGEGPIKEQAGAESDVPADE